MPEFHPALYPVPGLVPGTHVFSSPGNQDVDGRDKPGQGGFGSGKTDVLTTGIEESGT
jgi:hypothetical protein